MYEILETESSNESLNSFIENVKIPYLGRLPHKLRIGNAIKIIGKTNRNAQRFAINLMIDQTSCDDIALHFNPRFSDGFVVRNSRIKNNWCNEEREPNYLPFEPNQEFNIIIAVEEKVYQILINGIHFIDFCHRLPFSKVNCIAIDGDVKIRSIQYDNNYNNNRSGSLIPLLPPVQKPIDPIFDPLVPFTHQISNGLRIGMVFGIIGRPLNNARKFDINLIHKTILSQNADIALHISVRFGKNFNDSKVIRNSRFVGEWAEEEQYCHEFPFIPEKIFDMRIIVENNRFIIIVNGKNFAEYYNRLYPLSEINQIEINGDLILLSVRF
jgi:hypothetical protein